MNKTYHIGEYAKGGTISVSVDSSINLQAKEYKTNKVILEYNTTDTNDAYMKLLDWTSCYYADEILDDINNFKE